MTPEPPTLHRLRAAVIEFGAFLRPDRSWEALRAATQPRINPGWPTHQRALLTWLNAWGCRIRYPRQGEPDMFSDGVAGWWDRCGAALPAAGAVLTELSDGHIEALGDCFGDLVSVRVAPTGRRLGPTAASKMLYALRPEALLPWDDAIATHLHGARDARAYAGHLRLGRDWGLRLLAEAAMDEAALAVALGCPGRRLVKMLDDYCYIVYTRHGGEFKQ